MRNKLYALRLIRNLRHFDWILFLIILSLSTLGIIMLYSAANGSMTPWASKQLMLFGVGLIIFLLISNTSQNTIMSYAYAFYILSFALLVGVEILGSVGKGGQRWINLYFFKLQPSELMKYALVLALARYFNNINLREFLNFKQLAVAFGLVLLPSALVLKQPDLGTALMLIMTGSVMIFLAGMRLWMVIGAFVSVAAMIPVGWRFLYDYQRNRVLNFFTPEQDPLGSGYHIIQSKIAIGSGGLFGKGYMAGTQSHLDFLPEKQTDFIFTMFCEEFGFFGAVILLMMFVALIFYCLRISLAAKSVFSKLLGSGITTIVFLYVFINTAMVMGLLPAVGIPLPFLSYGGTSMVTIMFGMGLIASIENERVKRVRRSF